MAPKHFTSIDGAFGQKIHYDEYGRYAGESWPGLVSGSYTHYDADGSYAGDSMPGGFFDIVHYDADGHYVGESLPGFGSSEMHYGVDGYAGDSYDSFLGVDTFFDTDL